MMRAVASALLLAGFVRAKYSDTTAGAISASNCGTNRHCTVNGFDKGRLLARVHQLSACSSAQCTRRLHRRRGGLRPWQWQVHGEPLQLERHVRPQLEDCLLLRHVRGVLVPHVPDGRRVHVLPAAARGRARVRALRRRVRRAVERLLARFCMHAILDFVERA